MALRPVKKATSQASTDCLYELENMKYREVQYFHSRSDPHIYCLDKLIEKRSRSKEFVDFKKFCVW